MIISGIWLTMVAIISIFKTIIICRMRARNCPYEIMSKTQKTSKYFLCLIHSIRWGFFKDIKATNFRRWNSLMEYLWYHVICFKDSWKLTVDNCKLERCRTMRDGQGNQVVSINQRRYIIKIMKHINIVIFWIEWFRK